MVGVMKGWWRNKRLDQIVASQMNMGMSAHVASHSSTIQYSCFNKVERELLEILAWDGHERMSES